MSEEGAAPLQRRRVARSPLSSVSGTLELLREYMIVVCVLVLFLVLTFTSDTFLTSTNLLNVLQQVAPVGMVAFALTFLLIVGEFDLSSGALFVLTGVARRQAPARTSARGRRCAVATLAATAGGLINGLLVSYARINSFVAHAGHEPDGRRPEQRRSPRASWSPSTTRASSRWGPTSSSA